MEGHFVWIQLGSKASHIHFIYAPLHIRASAKQQIVARGTHLTVERAGSCLMSWVQDQQQSLQIKELCHRKPTGFRGQNILTHMSHAIWQCVKTLYPW